MRRWIVPGVALALVCAIGSGAAAQTPGSEKMDKDKMMDKKDGKMMDKMDKDKMMQKKDDMKMMDKKDDMKMQKKDDGKMMDKK